ncbi:hypothetical protein SBRCBS47491_002316 [Sporothrix bragantina]|uniref:Uncharacterized protein n=1 Tax=Sporothrix bragantina TaxID=671064 RepID=A0ABP0B5X4_9PEZI
MPIIPGDENGGTISRVDVSDFNSGSVSSAASTGSNNAVTTNATRTDNDDDDDTPMTVDQIATDYTIKLGINAAHTGWNARDAFRELVRSWRDSILATHHFSESKLRIQRFTYPVEEGSLEIVFTATEAKPEEHGKDSHNNKSSSNDSDNNDDNNRLEECLGYIRYKSSTKDSNGNFCDGTVDLVSRGATLQPWHFDLGISGGHKDKEEAGIYCESLPLVFVALMRDQHKHNIVCTSGGFLWIGNHNSKGRPVVLLRRLSEGDKLCTRDEHAKITNKPLPRTVQGSHRLFVPDTDTDVHVRIGGTCYDSCAHRPCAHNVCSQSGQPVERCGVSLADFKAWTKTALFLIKTTLSADEIVEMPHGDLLLPPALQGLRYLDGFLVCDDTTEWATNMQDLFYGYNFNIIWTDRSHRWPPSSFQELLIKFIWQAALAQRPDLTPLVHAIFQDKLCIKRFDSRGLARPLWQHLRRLSLAEDNTTDNDSDNHRGDHSKDRRGGIWYYSEQEGTANPQLPALIFAQGRHGVRLTDCYWKLLRKHCNVYTFSEMEQHELISAPIVAIGARVDASLNGPVTVTCSTAAAASHAAASLFQTSLIRLLHASFLGAQQTRMTGFVFVQPAARVKFDMAYMDRCRTFYIHARWLDLDMAASKLGFTSVGTVPGESYFFVVVINPEDEYAICSVTDVVTLPKVTATERVATTTPAPTVTAMLSAGPIASNHIGTAASATNTGPAQSDPNIVVADGALAAGHRKRRRTEDDHVSAATDAGHHAH